MRHSGPGRRARYCSPACRTRAYRTRSAPTPAADRNAIRERLGWLDARVDMPTLRALVSKLSPAQLVEVRRHLDAVGRAWEAVAEAAPGALRGPAPAVDDGAQLALTPPTAATVTAPPVTESDRAVWPASPPRKPVPAPSTAVRKVIGGLTPTTEQAAVIDACRSGDNAVITAGAGTGKTSTLRMAATLMKGRGLYVAFNRAIAADARRAFPKTVQCSTAHSLAFRAVGHAYKHRLDGPRLPARDVAARLGIDSGLALGDGVLVDPTQLARLTMETVDRYCRTADEQIGPQHAPDVHGVEDQAHAFLAGRLAEWATAAWADLRDVDGKLRFAHDHYLKMWALSRPDLRADYVLFDEAQDADPLIASVLLAQSCQLIAVGDECQAIYGWRGAVDTIAQWPAKYRLALTQSWRFGQLIADEANKWLAVLDARLRLTGNPGLRSSVGPVERPRAILCRTNAEALRQAMIALDAGLKPGLVGGATAIRRMAEAAQALQAGKGTDHPELFMFKSWGEVQQYVRDDAGGRDLAVFVRLVDEHGPEDLITAAYRLADERTAPLVISTAHKAKGREWDTVTIADDFREPPCDKDGFRQPVRRDEAMLAYVSVSRAKARLDRGSLDWIDQPTSGRVRQWSRDRDDEW
ncbi:DNA helicase [Pilimelia anulata]|uniref:DNA helicase n=1 Tax=Pilimelia anulata TaxID=53371 RepID=A0A8J3BC23_9ACTN|nr:DNA helicase [Pilimelia anulata]